MTDLEQQLTDHLRERASAATPRYDLDAVEEGISSYVPVRLDERRRRHPATVAMAAAAAVVVLVAIAVLRAAPDGDDPTPVTDPDQSSSGTIVSGDGSVWPEGTAPERPDGVDDSADVAGNHVWDAFDQDTGSFLYASRTGSNRVWILDEDGQERADFVCAPSATCFPTIGGEEPTFGPGPDEVSAPAASGRQALEIMGLDGTVRDTLDISASIGPYAAFAWSPDGSRLAVGTEPADGCDQRHAQCDVEVWTVDRDGGDPQLVYTQPTSAAPMQGGSFIVDLAWSPDGRNLGLLLAPTDDGGLAAGQWPLLIALRLDQAQSVRAHELHIFDDSVRVGPDTHNLFPHHYVFEFAFAWSPDGTRIAVTSHGGVAEISADDGHELHRLPAGNRVGPVLGGRVYGPLAWLLEP